MGLGGINITVRTIITLGMVYLSVPVTCEACQVMVRYVGEHRANGSWFCPSKKCSFNATFKALPLQYERRAHRVQDSAELFPQSVVKATYDQPVNVAHANGE